MTDSNHHPLTLSIRKRVSSSSLATAASGATDDDVGFNFVRMSPSLAQHLFNSIASSRIGRTYDDEKRPTMNHFNVSPRYAWIIPTDTHSSSNNNTRIEFIPLQITMYIPHRSRRSRKRDSNATRESSFTVPSSSSHHPARDDDRMIVTQIYTSFNGGYILHDEKEGMYSKTQSVP